jgi:hypothetical protein
MISTHTKNFSVEKMVQIFLDFEEFLLNYSLNFYDKFQ